MQRCEVGGSWWQSLNTPRPYVFALLILAGILLEFVVHFWFGIAVVYTHFYYLIIVLAGLWYGKRAVPIALFFGGLHIADTFLIMGTISPDALVRACMFVIVALIIGMTAEQSNCYRDQLIAQNRELEEANTRLESSQSAFQTANKKLNLLSSITRHDIRNQLLALMGFIGLAKMKNTDPGMLHFIEREERAAQNIQRQIEFTKNYEEIGVRAPLWQDIGMLCSAIQARVSGDGITISVAVEAMGSGSGISRFPSYSTGLITLRLCTRMTGSGFMKRTRSGSSRKGSGKTPVSGCSSPVRSFPSPGSR